MWKIEIKVNNFNIIFCLSHEITFFPINLRESEGVNRVRLLRQFAPGIEHKMKSWLSVWIVTKHAATRKLPKQGRPTQIPLRILFFSFFGFATRKFFFFTLPGISWYHSSPPPVQYKKMYSKIESNWINYGVEKSAKNWTKQITPAALK